MAGPITKIRYVEYGEGASSLHPDDQDDTAARVRNTLSRRPAHIEWVERRRGESDMDRINRFEAEARRIYSDYEHRPDVGETGDGAEFDDPDPPAAHAPRRTTKMSSHDPRGRSRPRPRRLAPRAGPAPRPQHYAPLPDYREYEDRIEDDPYDDAAAYDDGAGHDDGYAGEDPYAEEALPPPPRRVRRDPGHGPARRHRAAAQREGVIVQFHDLPDALADFCDTDLEYDAVHVINQGNCIHGVLLMSQDRRAFLPANIPDDETFILEHAGIHYEVACTGIKYSIPSGIYTFLMMVPDSPRAPAAPEAAAKAADAPPGPVEEDDPFEDGGSEAGPAGEDYS